MSKTGTTSLTTALSTLGYRCLHYPPLPELHELLIGNDAITDTSVACCFESLDECYPGSKFILTTRDPASWLNSARAEFYGRPVNEEWKLEVRRRLYRTTEWNEALFREAFVRHEIRVKLYFASRPQDLLVLNIFRGDGWKEICSFLGTPSPTIPFPHENQTHKTQSTNR